jgi:hypothetical protein
MEADYAAASLARALLCVLCPHGQAPGVARAYRASAGSSELCKAAENKHGKDRRAAEERKRNV